MGAPLHAMMVLNKRKVFGKVFFRFLGIALFLCLSCANTFSQVNIRVIDQDSKEPLIGVLVYTDDQEVILTTDLNGECILPDIGHRDIVHFQYVGYLTEDIPFYELRRNGGLIKLFTANTLDSIVVVGRRDDRVEEIPYRVERIDRKEIELLNAQTSAQILENQGSVFVQKSQMGGGSPVIRGFEANRVLLVVDGVRLNNAIYRSGHLQNAITLDNGILESVEVVFGPGSLMYGSDALGGVVHYRTKDPNVLHGKTGIEYEFKTNALTRYSSANDEKTIHVDLEYKGRRWASLTSATYSDFGDLRAGGNRPEAYPKIGERPFFIFRNEQLDEKFRSEDPNIQVGTAYRQIDLLQKLRFQKTDSTYWIVNGQFSTSSDVPRYDNLTDTLSSARDLKWAEWYYGPQRRLMLSIKRRALRTRGIYNKSTLIASFQRIDEDRLRRKWNKINRTFGLEDVYVGSFTGDFDKSIGTRVNLSYGIDLAYNDVVSKAGNINILTGNIRYNETTRYPSGGSSMINAGAYLNLQYRNRDSSVIFQMGGRYSYARLFAKWRNLPGLEIQWPDNYLEGISNVNTAPTFAAGITWNTKTKWHLRGLLASAFRSPNLDDFGKVRDSGDGFVLFPNTELGPERSVTGELSLGKTIGNPKHNLYIGVTAFYTQLRDLITRRSGSLLNGDSTIFFEDGIKLVQQNFNTNTGFIRGFSANAIWKWSEKIEMRGSVSLTEGREKFVIGQIDTLLPSAHIPPTYGQVSWNYKGDRFSFSARWKFNGTKPIEEYAVNEIRFEERGGLILDRFGTSDNLDETETCRYEVVNGREQLVCDGTPSWQTFDFYSGLWLNKTFELQFAIENILDYHYRTFSSGVSAPGRNFILSLRATF